MEPQDIKLIALNSVSLALSFSDYLETGLKILLLMVSIAYTFMKWLELYEKRKRYNESSQTKESGSASEDKDL